MSPHNGKNNKHRDHAGQGRYTIPAGHSGSIPSAMNMSDNADRGELQKYPYGGSTSHAVMSNYSGQYPAQDSGSSPHHWQSASGKGAVSSLTNFTSSQDGISSWEATTMQIDRSSATARQIQQSSLEPTAAWPLTSQLVPNPNIDYEHHEVSAANPRTSSPLPNSFVHAKSHDQHDCGPPQNGDQSGQRESSSHELGSSSEESSMQNHAGSFSGPGQRFVSSVHRHSEVDNDKPITKKLKNKNKHTKPTRSTSKEELVEHGDTEHIQDFATSQTFLQGLDAETSAASRLQSAQQSTHDIDHYFPNMTASWGMSHTSGYGPYPTDINLDDGGSAGGSSQGGSTSKSRTEEKAPRKERRRHKHRKE